MMTKLRYKCYNKQITTCDSGNVQSHDQKEIKLNSTINKNNVAHNHTHNKIIKNTLNMLNTATIKRLILSTVWGFFQLSFFKTLTGMPKYPIKNNCHISTQSIVLFKTSLVVFK